MVGAWPDSAWDAAEVALAPGDVLVLYTDGVTDACRADGERFGEERLAAVLSEAVAAGAGAEQAVAAVHAALRAFEDGPQADDTAIVALQRAPVGAPDAQSWSAPALPESVGRLRNAVAEFARAAGLAEERVGELRLAVSEALTNAVVHGYRGRGDGPLLVRARAAEDHLEVVVEDEGVGPAPRPDSPGAGVGLPVMAALTLETSIRERDGGGTVVQLLFPVD
jgi:serine/threonine-protein kinase RsbW/stage II sporulation protein AB (anti-sigma F factor)